MLTFKKNYFFLAIGIFLLEIFIASFVSGVIRTFGGDLLVVVLLYFLARTFWDVAPFYIALSVLAFSFSIEIAQYFNLVNILGLSGNRTAEIIIGTRFDWLDFLAYTLGTFAVYHADLSYSPE